MSPVVESHRHFPKHLRASIRYAQEHEYEDSLEYYLAAVLVRGGTVLSVGYNKRGTNGFVEHYADVARGRRDYCMSIHAEMGAVLLARGKSNLRGAKIYVARVRSVPGVGLAQPCEICQHVLFNYGVTRAIYTINDQEYGVMRIKNPAKLHEHGR
jgi:deoxycytidylate deaminase